VCVCVCVCVCVYVRLCLWTKTIERNALVYSPENRQKDNKSSAVAEMGDRLATIDMRRKVGGVCCAPLHWGGRSWVPMQHNLAWAEAYLHTKWHLDSSSCLATIDMGGKVGEGLLCPFLVGGAGTPSNIMWPGPRPISVPSGILIHPTVWPQYTNVTDRHTDRQTGQTAVR